MRSLAKTLFLLALLVAVGVAAPARAEGNSDAAEVRDSEDVAPSTGTDEVRGKGCTSVCLNSGEDPYRCEEDCVFVTGDAAACPAS